MASKIFTDLKAKRRFVDLYEMATEEQKDDFGKAIRAKFDEKITSLDELTDFYLTEEDVTNVWNGVDKIH